jgi:hypothetical protein
VVHPGFHDKNLLTFLDGGPIALAVIIGTLAQCDPCGIPSTSRWTVAAIIGQYPRTKTYIVTRWKTSIRPMLSSLAG